MTEMPLGYETSKKDWLGLNGKPYSLDEWNRLTLGEQQRYGAKELEEKQKLNIEPKIKNNIVTVSISVADMAPYSEKELAWIKFDIEKKLKETMYWMSVRRQNGWDL